ncbi:MAG: NAD(P)-dependent oxidoreductase [bacterium]|nr:NAD(P)-dependent oxidoreductase [bacterium]
MKKIGIVGLGIMGRGIAHNFLKNKYSVYVWNRTNKVSEEFKNKGAIVCDSPSEVAQKADVVFEITSNDKSSHQVWTGTDGIISGARKESVLIASSTLSAEWVDALSTLCKKRKLSFMDIALTGGRVGAENGTLTLLCGGKDSTLKEITPVLESISKKIYHFGPVGHGMKYKLILNFLQAVHMVGFGQAMKIAKSYNMDLKKVSSALVDRPGGVITQIAQKAYFDNPPALTFSIENITKDLGYAKKLAKGLNLGLLDKTLALYKSALKKNMSKEDWATINKVI